MACIMPACFVRRDRIHLVQEKLRIIERVRRFPRVGCVTFYVRPTSITWTMSITRRCRNACRRTIILKTRCLQTHRQHHSSIRMASQSSDFSVCVSSCFLSFSVSRSVCVQRQWKRLSHYKYNLFYTRWRFLPRARSVSLVRWVCECRW